MEDIERYGDYDEVDEAPSDNKNILMTVMKIAVCVVCFAVVGILLFRVILFNYYPKEMKNIYFNEALAEHYELVGEDFSAKTQTLRAPYDDPDFASFFCDNLIVIEAAGQLQVSVRYNSSIFDTINEKYGVALDPESEDLFSFSLERVPFGEDAEPYQIGELDYVNSDSSFMYTYYKLVFDGIDGESFAEGTWIRLKITINGIENAKPYYVLIYENTDEYNRFSDYELSRKEIPS